MPYYAPPPQAARRGGRRAGSGCSSSDWSSADESLADAYRWGGAATLADAATKNDGQYKSLSDPLDKIYRGFEQFDFSGDAVTAAAKLAQSFCAAHFP
jgi:hypothetical protein